MKILIGTDPELFLTNEEGVYFSGHDLLPGTKQNPFLVERGAVQVDGVACEFNIFPAETEDEFVKNINTVRSIMQEMVWQRRPDLTLTATPTAFFKPEYFFALPAHALALGCEPDFNAYTGVENDPPGTDEPFRTGSGHIHIGWTSGQDFLDTEHFALCRRVVKQLDASLYPLSLSWDSDTKRQQLYGKPGAFRPKHYGVEYRPLSNAYLRDEEVIRLVFQTAVQSVRDLLDGKEYWREAA